MVVGGAWRASGVGEVVDQELSATALNAKYEWFKDSAAQLDAKIAKVRDLRTKITDMEKMYEGEKRRDWALDDRTSHSLWKTNLNLETMAEAG
jgi:hypothetical protein